MSDLLHPSRRTLLTGIAALICAPAIVRATSLMPVKSWNVASLPLVKGLRIGDLIDVRQLSHEQIQKIFGVTWDEIVPPDYLAQRTMSQLTRVPYDAFGFDHRPDKFIPRPGRQWDPRPQVIESEFSIYDEGVQHDEH